MRQDVLYLFDCDNTEPANFFAVLVEFGLSKTLEATFSTFVLVSLPLFTWESADPASCLAAELDFGSRRTFEAVEAMLLDVVFLFAILVYLWVSVCCFALERGPQSVLLGHPFLQRRYRFPLLRLKYNFHFDR